ncbi:MAG: branched-chain amino acid aminotransferase [Hyphomicrobiales bacterium]
MSAWNYWQGSWIEGNPLVMGPMSHGAWLASTVFDGARAFEGTMPDLDLHCARMVRSVDAMGLQTNLKAEEIMELAKEGISKFPSGTALYIKPMFWAEEGLVTPVPETTQFCLNIFEAEMPEPASSSITVSPFRRPSAEFAPTDAKAACHYPNSARAMREAASRGFDNALMLDPLGNVAELATANIFCAKDGVAHTPAPNGAFLNGITRQRTIKLLEDAGVKVYQRHLTAQDFLEADEIFSTGNYSKIVPITRLEDRDYQPGPVYARARELYWDYAHNG